ncbi:hypothetical protein [Microtetraspora sp. NBRC 16547]|uniref:hypothetical protein n=1 Tax=Microtetraspora sp. NBRC 16547 TaxID=3030993 RepID=UPI00249FD187|nr:hypothetical protein [Microtetraspora sp. NBRC 16547]GLW96291.1 hypothetical protein Misp02_03780 [Microtetraspora sp. NBRC 16547]
MGYPGDQQQPHRQPYLPQGVPPTADQRRPEARPYGSAFGQPGQSGQADQSAQSGQEAPAFDPWRRPQRDAAQQAGPQAGPQTGSWEPGGRPGNPQAGTWAQAASQPSSSSTGSWGPGGASPGNLDAGGSQPGGTAPWSIGDPQPGSPLSGNREPGGSPYGTAPGATGQPSGYASGGSQPGGYASGGSQGGGYTSGGFPPGAQPDGAGNQRPPGGHTAEHSQPGSPEAGGSLSGDSQGRRASASSEPPRAERRAAEPSQPPWDPYGPVPLWRHPIVLGLAGLALIGALFAGLWVAASREKPVRAVSTPTPTPVTTPGPGGKYGYAGSRTTDKTPLTATELFGQKKVTNGTRSYLRTKVNKEKTCNDGVSGEKITKALKAGGCTQLIRASYKDSKGTIIGTIGVANLKTTTAATKVASAGGGKERQDFLKPLPGTDDVSKLLGTGDAYAGGWVHGHYTVLLWFQFKDGHNPNKTELKQLYRAAMDITEKTVFPALDTRSLTGGHG